jgi:hypothetical protein
LLLTLGSHIVLAIFGAWITGGVVILAGCLFYWYFMRLDFDPKYTSEKIFFVYSAFLLVVLILGLGGRGPVSNIAAFVGVALELYFGWQAATRQVRMVTN